MFGTIRKHQKWLWWCIVIIVVLGMATFTQMNRSGNGRGMAGNHGEIDGRPITDTEFQNAWYEAELTYYMNRHEFPDNVAKSSGWNQEQQTYQRIFLVRKLDQYNIHADSDSVAKLASLFLQELGRSENVEHIPMSTFESRVLQPHHLTSEDFQRFLEHYISIQQLISVIGASGTMVPPSEIESLYKQGHEEAKVQAAVFSASNYLATIPEPTTTLLGQFYSDANNTNGNREAKYLEPDRLQVSFVHFNITNYLTDAEKAFGTNLNREVQDAFSHGGTNLFSLGKTEAEQKAKIREYIIRGAAYSNAYTAAISFQRELNSKEPVRADNLNAIAKEKGLEVKTSKPFDKEYGPSDFELPPNTPASSLFDLTADDPFPATPLRSEDGIYIVAFNKFIPSRVPPLDEIRSRVVADCKEFEATRTAQMNAQIFEQTVTNGLAQGKTFAAICAGAKVKPLDLPPFSVSTQSLPELEDEVDLNAFKQRIIETPAGKTSGLIPTRSGAMVVYVQERLPVDPSKMQADMPNFSKMVRQARQNQAFDLWFQKEASAALRNILALQQQGRS